MKHRTNDDLKKVDAVRIKTLGEIDEYLKSSREFVRFECIECGREVNMMITNLKRKTELTCKGCETKRTILARFGTETLFHGEKARQTCLEKYGAPSHTQTDEFKKKQKENWLKTIEKYGTFNIKYWYDEKPFDSSWEIAYYIFLTDTEAEFEYHPGPIDDDYVDENGITRKFFPDFKVNGEYQEIKGEQFFGPDDEPIDPYHGGKSWKAKLDFMKFHGVRIIRQKDLKVVFKYIEDKYGKGYLATLKIAKPKKNVQRLSREGVGAKRPRSSVDPTG